MERIFFFFFYFPVHCSLKYHEKDLSGNFGRFHFILFWLKFQHTHTSYSNLYAKKSAKKMKMKQKNNKKKMLKRTAKGNVYVKEKERKFNSKN